jgi:hypothetical protein
VVINILLEILLHFVVGYGKTLEKFNVIKKELLQGKLNETTVELSYTLANIQGFH